MADEFSFDVFLSHSSRDKEVVRELAKRLKRDGLRVWFDQWEIKPGDSIPSKIEEGLEHSRVLVLCMSANAFGSDWSQLESGTFRFRDPLNKERRFIPLRLDQSPIKGSLTQFRHINWPSANREQEYAMLIESCRPPAKSTVDEEHEIFAIASQCNDGTPSTSVCQDSLKAIRDALQRQVSDLASNEHRVTRRKRLDEMLAQGFRNLVSFVGGMLALDKQHRNDSFFDDLASSLLTFNSMLKEAAQEYPRYRIRERLESASKIGIPALSTAAALLLVEPEFDPPTLARELERVQACRPYDVWSIWLTYILDQLLNSHRPPATNLVPPDTTREEWRKAESAFGCILFSDESFRNMQDCMDQAAAQIDDAMKSGGYCVPTRPPARVRDMIARFDPRALHWYGSEFPPWELLQPPQAIDGICDPKPLRRKLDELWTAANCLQIAIDKWQEWFRELSIKGDAHPAIALNCCEMACRAISVLCAYRPNIVPFRCEAEQMIVTMLPPIPGWWVPESKVVGASEHANAIQEHKGRWQEDREFLDRYYCQPEDRLRKVTKLRGAVATLIEMLKSFPLAVVSETVDTKSVEALEEFDRFASEPLREQVRLSDEAARIKLDNESKERVLVGDVISTVSLAGQIAREITVSDWGLDMEIEFKDDHGEATGQRVYLQLKSGDSHLKTRKSDGVETFAIKNPRHATLWREQPCPVFLVVRSSAGEVRWMEIREYLQRESQDGNTPVKQIVFTGERLDVMSVRRWRERLLKQD